MDGWVVAIFVPTVLFVLVVAPTWIYLHYRSKQASLHALSAEERDQIEVLTASAERMQDRINALESILDERTPDWRTRMID